VAIIPSPGLTYHVEGGSLMYDYHFEFLLVIILLVIIAYNTRKPKNGGGGDEEYGG
jgi:hypothetical protein